jgi:MFS family permease
MKFLSSLGALRARNFRRYMIGQSLSLIGTWMQQLAMSWLVYRLTGSAALLGATVFCSQIPMLFLSPFAGVWVDRVDKRRVVIVTQSLLMLQAAAIAALAATGLIRVWHILVLNILFGMVNSLDMPCRQSLVPELVDKREDLGNAIALNATMVNVTRLLGPSLAGLTIAAVGEAACFALNAASFLAVIISLFFISTPHRAKAPHKSVMTGFRDGLNYAFGFEPIRALLILLAMVSLMGMPYTVLLPVFATRVLGGDARTMGFLSAGSGLGALFGALYLASRGTVRGLLRRIAVSAALFGAGLVGFAASRRFWLSETVLFAAGFGVMIMMAAANTVLQTLADDDKRGRVMSFYVTALMGLAPIGGLVTGVVAQRFGPNVTVMVGGFFCMGSALAFALRIPALRVQMRPVYIERGVVPPGLGTAAEIAGRTK